MSMTSPNALPTRQDHRDRQLRLGAGALRSLTTEPARPGSVRRETPKAVVQAKPAPVSEEEQKKKEWAQRQLELHPRLPMPKRKRKGGTFAEFLQKAVAKDYGISHDDMLSEKRTAKVVLPRQVAMHLATKMTKLSLSEVGGPFKRDHTTVLHAKNKIAWLIGERDGISESFRKKENLPVEVDTELAACVARLEQEIRTAWDYMRAADQPSS